MNHKAKLNTYLQSLEKVCIGYSGGVDSAFLLKAAYDCLGNNAIAIIANGPMLAKRDFKEAVQTAEAIGAPYYILDVNPLQVPELKDNIKERCYYCKKSIFSQIMEKARALGFDKVADGKNTDDDGGFRPGAKACKELGVISPLYDCGFAKKDIRAESKKLGLPTWEKPSNSCLFTRIPYYEEVTLQKLTAIEQAEDILRDMGLKTVRVRAHGDLARIEIAKEDIPGVLQRENLAGEIKKAGFKFVTVDMEGFRSGSMDE